MEIIVSVTRLTKRASAGAFVLAATLGLGTASVLPAYSAAAAAAPSATTTTLELKSTTVAYGDTSKVVVTVDTATSGDPKPAGKVELTIGNQALVADVPNSGRVEFDLPLLDASTTPYALTATFIPTDPLAFSASSAPPASVTVTKDATTSKVTARHRALKRQVIAKNFVTSANGQVPRGEVKFVLRRNGHKVATSVVSLDGTSARTKFLDVPQAGSYKVVAKYLGSANFLASKGSYRITL